MLKIELIGRSVKCEMFFPLYYMADLLNMVTALILNMTLVLFQSKILCMSLSFLVDFKNVQVLQKYTGFS